MYKTIMALELEEIVRKNKVNIIDVREEDEIKAGHIPGIIHMPLSEFGKHLDKINKNEHYYIVCRSGQRSGVASKFLSEQGFDVTNVLGGMMTYQGKTEDEMW